MAGLFLGLDTATEFLTLALWSADEGVLARSEERLGREHGRRILPSIEALLRRATCRPTDLAGIGVGVGPGSYTGLRIGLATTIGMARALDLPLAGCDTLAAIAVSGAEPDTTVVALIDAGRGNVYAGSYRCTGGEPITLMGPRKMVREQVAEQFPGAPLVEALPPDAALIARRVSAGAPARAIYL